MDRLGGGGFVAREVRRGEVNPDRVQTVEQARLVGYVGSTAPGKIRDVCRALAIAVACDA